MTDNTNKILLISGSGRNVGKTSFIRRVIACNYRQNVTAVKITPHFHEPTDGLIPLFIAEHYRIYRETNLSSEKDSSLFLKAGASSVFYIQTSDLFIREAFNLVLSLIPFNGPIITESAILRKYFTPALYIFIQSNYSELKPESIEMKEMADIISISDTKSFTFLPENVVFDNNWKIKQA